MRRPRLKICLIVLTIVWTTAAAAIAGDVELEFLGEADLPPDLEIDGTLVGGLSGLAYDPGCQLFYAISDDRGYVAPPRFYTLRIVRSEGKPRAEILEATLLRNADAGVFERGVLDPEGIALDANGTLYLSSEGGPDRGAAPFVARMTFGGVVLGEFELPAYYLPRADGSAGVRNNLGFEGLDVTPDGALLFATVEDALLQDGPVADLGVRSPARILVFDTVSGLPQAEYLYEVEAVPDEPQPASAFRTNGISEIVTLDASRLLVIERSFSAGVGNRVRLYLADLSEADNILGRERLAGPGTEMPRAATKTLVADLSNLGIAADNIEGAALGPQLDDGRRLLVLVADNNFQPAVQKNQVLFFAASGVPQPTVRHLRATIPEVQGAAHFSPLNGRCVASVTGVVTAVLGSRKGQAFWIQDPVDDGDPATSQGVLVTAPEGLPQIAVGDEVRVDGRVEEPLWGDELPVTRLRATATLKKGSGSAMPEPVVIGDGGVRIPPAAVASPGLQVFDPSLYAADAFESLEGMLVRINGPVVVGPTSRYGEAVVLTDRGFGVGPRTARGGLGLGDSGPSLERIVISDRLESDQPLLTVGDRLAGPVEGILHYTYGAYKVLNTTPSPGVEAGGLEREVTALGGDREHLTVATFNLENLSALSPEDKLVALGRAVALNLRSPDILAIQEVQDDSGPKDDGTVTAEATLSRLTAAIEAAGGAHYDWRSIDPVDGADGGQPGANIRTAFLFNPARVSFVDRGAGAAADGPAGPFPEMSPGLVAGDAPAFAAGADGHGGTRKPLAGEFLFAGRRLVVVNLHLVSKGGDDPLFGLRQPPLRPSTTRREAQASAVGESVRLLMEEDPGTMVIVLGDFNDFVDSSPVHSLEAAGLEDLVKRLPKDDRYTYVFLGRSQALDHFLVSPDLGEDAEVDAVHLAAEFPAAERATDHDPIVVRLKF